MSVNLVWDDSQHATLRFDYAGEWTWNEWYAAMDEAEKLIREHSDTVYFINHLEDSAYLPKNAMTNFKQNAIHFHSMVRLTFIVSENLFIKVMFNTFKRFAGAWAEHYHYVTSLDEARQMIAEDATEYER
jgi:hypothetical protein